MVWHSPPLKLINVTSVIFFQGFQRSSSQMWFEKNTRAIFSSQPFALISVCAGQSLHFPGFACRVCRYLVSFCVRLNIAIKKRDFNFSENRWSKVFFVCVAFRSVSKLHLPICVHAKIFLAGKSCSSRTARIRIVSFCRVEFIFQ